MGKVQKKIKVICKGLHMSKSDIHISKNLSQDSSMQRKEQLWEYNIDLQNHMRYGTDGKGSTALFVFQ